ncbi:protein LURP-one-related 15-like [Phragmites australis]|uniref:protein LURP-one-related 15-like n=1 Tax=Phragmites australis TaxID=29695 RepID=UPI002D7803DA|nr:protein LURP-one-related 15-like [Phragmites australis]
MEMGEAAPALAVVDARFCAADAASLAVAKTLSMSGSDFAVTDAATGALVLRVDGVLFSLRRRSVLVDADGRPVLTVQESALLLNTRWKVFRGDSTSRRDLLFTVVKPSAIQLRWSTKVSVFLASNDAEQACDFRITGSYHDGACTVSLGDSDTVIAKINRRFSVVSALLGKNTYSVTVNPGIDYAFVVALVVILDEMHYQR